MRIAIGSDHAGFELKQAISQHLAAQGHDIIDLGTDDSTSVDYPEFGAAVGRSVASADTELGVAVCGSGQGICMAANKIPGIRAATVWDVTSAQLTRRHNNANVMCVGQRLVGPQIALDAVDAFVAADFEGGRHSRRVDKLTDLDADRTSRSEA